ncbi:MAG: efflux RND transporter permease subunit [Leptolyngbyaceae bacterium]|nr:efflux RND transporter permease subunit [Leptolyngbyaceae bacterium]
MPNPPSSSGLSISRLASRRHIGTFVLAIAVVVLGIFIISRLPVDLLPSITYPRIGMRVEATGVAPEVAVDEVTRPLEEALSATEGVVTVFSRTREGRISIDLFFEPGGDIDQALNDATASLNRARESLPDNLEQPRLFKFEPSQLPVYEMALTSDALSALDLRIFADEELGRELLRIPGVANVDISGGVQEEVQVNIDLQRLQSFGIDLTDVLDALEERNQDTSGGRLRGGDDESLTRLVGRFQSADEIRNLAIAIEGTNPPQQIYLRDVADIIDGTEEQRIFVTLNGLPAVKVSIQKQPDANTVTVVDAVKEEMEFLRQTGVIPEGMLITNTLDESRFIRSSIQNVTTAGLTGATLAAIAVLLFLGSIRQTLIIVFAIPLAILSALVMMGLFGLSLNVFSLGGLALGVGIVVDNSIVMLENIANALRPRSSLPDGADASTDENGNGNSNGNGNGDGDETGERKRRLPKRLSQRLAESAIRQAEASSQELESALLASTSTNLVAVLPFLLIGGFISLLFNELILTISFAVAASLIVALTVVPTLAARLLAIPGSSQFHRLMPIRWFNQRLNGITIQYGRLLAQILQHRVWIIAGAIAILGGSSFWMVDRIPQEILPRINTGQADVRVQFPPGTPIADNRQVMQEIDRLLLEQPETDYVFTTSGGSLFASTTSVNALRGDSTITLKPNSDVTAFVERMNTLFSQLPVVDTNIRASPESVRGLILTNSPVRAEIDVGLQGNDSAVLQETGQRMLATLSERVSLARFSPDAEEPQPEIQIRPDWERVADLGLSAQDLGDTIQTALDGSVPTQLQRSDRLVDIRVQLPRNSIQRSDQLREIPLFTADNQLVRLGDIAEIEQGVAPGEIQRINQRQVYLIEGDLAEDASLSQALEEVSQVLSEFELPEGVSLLPSFNADTNRELQASLRLLGGLAAFFVFVVMAVQYNALIDPLVIMLTVPLALAGGIFGLYVTQTAIGATVIVGAVLLVGIVVNNAIIMVELANQIRLRDNITPREAILLAAPQRLRPILMTTITTVLGLFPLALGLGEGSEFLQPMGIVVFSGLSLATFLTLFIIPCFYTLLHNSDWQRWSRQPEFASDPLPADTYPKEPAQPSRE